MGQANLPIKLCEDAVVAIAYILNWVPSKSVCHTSHDLWASIKPIWKNLQP